MSCHLETLGGQKNTSNINDLITTHVFINECTVFNNIVSYFIYSFVYLNKKIIYFYLDSIIILIYLLLCLGDFMLISWAGLRGLPVSQTEAIYSCYLLGCCEASTLTKQFLVTKIKDTLNDDYS